MINKEAFEAWLASDGEITFDIYAQNPDDWSELNAIVPGLRISSAGGIVPFQAEGLLQGLPFYYKDRDGWATLRVGEADGTAFENVLYSASMESVEFSESEHFPYLLVQLVKNLTVAPFRWEFMGKELVFPEDDGWADITGSDEDEIQYGWGLTPEEGYAQLAEISEYLVEHGATEQIQKRMLELQQVNPHPVNIDDRKFPTPEPIFLVTEP